MKYCINISSLENCFRLQSDITWKKCDDNSKILEGDFITDDPDVIRKLQVKNKTIKINNEKYEIEPDLVFEFGNFNQLSYSIFGYREKYPIPPNIENLKEVLVNGDDSRFNSLVLLTNGKFDLYSPKEIGEIKNPTIVLQHEGFVAGNEYVGKKLLKIKNLDNYLHDFFRTSIYYWKKHLVTKQLHMQSDYIQGNNIDDLLDLFSELNDIKENWAQHCI